MSAPGRVPPHSVEAEEQLLSACLLDGGDVVSRCLEEKIAPASFYIPANRLIFEKLVELYGAGKPIDLSVLFEELKKDEVLDEMGGLSYLTRISGRIPTTAGASYFIEKVRELALLRDVIRACTGGVEDAYNFTGGISAFVDKVEADLFKVTQNRVGDSARLATDAIDEAMATYESMMARKGVITGLPIGLTDIDRTLYGLQRQEMIVLAGRPSCGKTALALNFTEHAVLPRKGAPVPVLFFSLEMSRRLLALRLLASRAGVNQKMARDGFLKAGGPEMQALEAARQELRRAPLFIDDASSPSVMEIRAKARRIHARQPLGLIVVDYLQLIAATEKGMLREQQVAEASRGLKALAKELDVPVLVLSQLNRSSEQEKRRPRLSDLRESGAIEQDADVVLMLARPPEQGDASQVAASAMDLVIAKNRNGEVGDVRLTFINQFVRFENWTQ
jgi:replicative DNA helicase